MTLPALLTPTWMDPQTIIQGTGAAALWIVALIAFAECGLAVFFMPGDSLLFALGMFAAVGVNSTVPLVHYGSVTTTLIIVNVVLIICAIAGNICGYWIGYLVGPKLFREREGFMGKVFSPKHVDTTHEFFRKHGSVALILARFVPIVRTFVTMIAGVGRMTFQKFIILYRYRRHTLGTHRCPGWLFPRPNPRRSEQFRGGSTPHHRGVSAADGCRMAQGPTQGSGQPATISSAVPRRVKAELNVP